jgi:hypothetical protein
MDVQRVTGNPLDQLRLPADPSQARPRKNRPPSSRTCEWFVKGPIPGPWLSKASALDGKAFHLGVSLWYLAGVHKSLNVKLTRDALERFGVGRKAAWSNLKRLESAGLVSVARGPGRLPIVTIRDAP